MGAGELGQAVGTLLRKKDVAPIFWDADTSKVSGQKPLEEIIPSADMVLFCVPSWAMRDAIVTVRPFLKSQCPLISFAKGMEEKTQKTMYELFSEIVPAHPFAAIGGPMLAEEISGGMTAAGVIASKDEDLRQQLRDLFASPRFRAEISDDPFGISLAGVIKNIYAVSLGIADGLTLSGNEKGWLVSVAIREMIAIGTALGVPANIILGTAGIGDLVATGYSPHSHNRRVGDEIVRNGTCTLRGEGLASLPPLIRRLGDKANDFPLLDLVKRICIDCEPAEPAFTTFWNSDETHPRKA